MADQNLQERAADKAAEVLQVLGITSAPVDPLAVAESEAPLLTAVGADFRNKFDGQLEYHRKENRFLLFFNTKYDAGRPEGHHPRTRFSIAHELGHFFLDHHRTCLVRSGKPHPSSSEFRSDTQIEREADAFAASLLMPAGVLSPMLAGEVSVAQVMKLADQFKTSHLSTAIRAVRLSDFPCAVAGIRDGHIAWMFPSESLVEGGLYPSKGAAVTSRSGRERWDAFTAGETTLEKAESLVTHWFQTYERERLEELWVTEEYLPVQIMDTLVVLLTIDESDLFPDEDEEESDADD